MLRIFRTIVDFAKKAFLVVGVFYIILAIFGNVINKNRPQYDTKKFIANNQKQIYSVLSDKSLTQTKAGQLKLLLHRLSTCTFMGELCTNTPSDDPKYFKTSLVGQVSSLISLTYVNPPASGVYWVNNTLQNAGLVPNTYAAEGAGFAMIKPLMNLWKIFRDIAYLLIVLVLVAIGFMIMFRMKINPQTVISVENALPRIVVSLLLITFSFAIAGFLIDVMYLLIVLIIGILSNNNTFYDANQMQNTYLQSDFATLWNSIIPIPASMKGFIGIPKFAYIGDAFMALLPEEINVWSHIIASVAGVGFGTYGVVQIYNSSGLSDALNNIVLLGNGLGGALKALFGGVLLVIIPLIVWQLIVHGLGFIIGFIVSLAILGMLFNIFFLLLRSYIQITLSIVFSPIILLFEALPGKSTFSYWVKGLMGELLTFPIVITLLLVEKIMFMTMTYPGQFWTPPFLVSLNPAAFSVIFGMGLVLITPDIIKLVKESIGAKPLPFNLGVGTFMSGGGAVIGGGMGILQQFSTLSLGLTGIGNLKNMFTAKSKTDQDYEKVIAKEREQKIKEFHDASGNK